MIPARSLCANATPNCLYSAVIAAVSSDEAAAAEPATPAAVSASANAKINDVLIVNSNLSTNWSRVYTSIPFDARPQLHCHRTGTGSSEPARKLARHDELSAAKVNLAWIVRQPDRPRAYSILSVDTFRDLGG